MKILRQKVCKFTTKLPRGGMFGILDSVFGTWNGTFRINFGNGRSFCVRCENSYATIRNVTPLSVVAILPNISNA